MDLSSLSSSSSWNSLYPPPTNQIQSFSPQPPPSHPSLHEAVSRLFTEVPQYPINGPISADPKDLQNHDFFEFLGKYRPLVSYEQRKIDRLHTFVSKGDYPYELINDPHLPPIVLALFEQHRISKWDNAQLLTFHSISVHHPSKLTILPIFDECNEISQELFKNNRIDRITSNVVDPTIPRDLLLAGIHSIKKLSPSQKVFYFENDQLEVNLSIQAESVFHEAIIGRIMNAVFRVGIFTPQEILEGIYQFQKTNQENKEKGYQIEKNQNRGSYRLVHIPYPNIPSPEKVHNKPANAVEASMHDRYHSQLGSLLEENHTVANGELISVFSSIVKDTLSKEMWELGDSIAKELLYRRIASINDREPMSLTDPDLSHDLILVRLYELKKLSPTQSFELFFRSKTDNQISLKELFGQDKKRSLFGWIAFFHIMHNQEEWSQKYGINFDQIRLFYPMLDFYKMAAPYIKRLSLLQQIYCLQTIREISIRDLRKVKIFLKNFSKKKPMVIPRKIKEEGKFKNYYHLAIVENKKKKRRIMDLLISKIENKKAKNLL